MDNLVDWVTSRLVVEVFTDVVLKATIILGMAWLATALLHRASAAVRHGVWGLALVGLLMLPLLSSFLPSWDVGIPARIQPLLVYHPAPAPPNETSLPVFSAEGQSATTTTPQQAVVDEPVGAGRIAPDHKTPPDAGLARVPGSARPLGWPWPAWILLVWGIGASVLLGRFGLHMLRAWIITRHAELLADARHVAEVAHLARRLGIRRRLRVLCSPAVSMPMTWGLWRPVVMLPHRARLWSDERRRVVLLHELAHIKRWDYLVHLATQVTRALYWFNPLIWVAARRIHVEQERACDDQVLQAGAGACDYATHLLDIARMFLKRPIPMPGGIAMLGGSTLKERVLAILNTHSNRHALSLKTGLAATCLGVGLILPVAAVQLCPIPTQPRTSTVAAMPHADPLLASQEGLAEVSPMERLRADDPAVWHNAALSPDLEAAALTELLAHQDATLQGRAAWGLGERGASEAVGPLLVELDDEDPKVRVQVVRALAKIEDHRALEPLAAMLDDACPNVRIASVRALEKVCPCHALEALPVALRDPSPQVRMTAAHVLSETIRALRADDSPRARRALQTHLGSAVEGLIVALRDESTLVRQRVAYALGETWDETAIEALKAAIHDRAAPVRLEVIRALGKIGVPCAASAVRLALNDQDPEVRALAASVLDQLEAS